jgi:regulatory protein YycI of two-component signal transduction system YycFG
MEFLNIEINNSRYIKILIVSIILVIVYLALTMSSLLICKSYKLGSNTTVISINPENNVENVEDGEISAHIDLLEHETNGKTIEISGWAFREGAPLNTINSSYVLKHQETGKMYFMATEMEENINLVEEEHKKAGLHARSLVLGMPKGMYDVYVQYQNDDEDILVFTLISFELD